MQTTFRVVVTTSDGQITQGVLSDNVKIDFTTSPPTIRATRPALHIPLARQTDGSYMLPGTVNPNGAWIVVRNGLDLTEGGDYVKDASKIRIVPTGPWPADDTVKVHIFY
jgi:hypothetical protein